MEDAKELFLSHYAHSSVHPAEGEEPESLQVHATLWEALDLMSLTREDKAQLEDLIDGLEFAYEMQGFLNGFGCAFKRLEAFEMNETQQ